MRRVFTILALVIVLGGIAVAGYFYFFGNTASVVVAPSGDVTLPDAGVAPQTPGEPTATTTIPTSSPTSVSARLVKISSGPIVPGMVVNRRAATASSSVQTLISFIERQSGNVFSYDLSAGTLTRTSNRTIPGIQAAAWLPSAARAFVRYLSGSDFSTVNAYALSADGSLPAQAGDGFFLAQNLSDIAVSSTSILTLASGVNGSVASLARIDGTNSSTVFTTPLSDLRISFAGKSQYLAYTKASSALPGFAFLVDATGTFSRIAGPRNGLVALASPSGTWVLISYTTNGALQMELVNTATGEVTALPIATIAEKCVWTADDSAIYCGIPVDPPAGLNYPDDWYQGAVAFSDKIWRIQVSGRYAQFVLDFAQEAASPLDATALAVDSGNSTLVFINKNDGSLWSYEL